MPRHITPVMMLAMTAGLLSTMGTARAAEVISAEGYTPVPLD